MTARIGAIGTISAFHDWIFANGIDTESAWILEQPSAVELLAAYNHRLLGIVCLPGWQVLFEHERILELARGILVEPVRSRSGAATEDFAPTVVVPDADRPFPLMEALAYVRREYPELDPDVARMTLVELTHLRRLTIQRQAAMLRHRNGPEDRQLATDISAFVRNIRLTRGVPPAPEQDVPTPPPPLPPVPRLNQLQTSQSIAVADALRDFMQTAGRDQAPRPRTSRRPRRAGD